MKLCVPFGSFLGVAAAALVALIPAVWCGCETSGGDVSDFQLSPTAVSLDATVTTGVVFTVVGGTAPYTWSVSDDALGALAAAGATAIYTSEAAAGTNTLTVTDADAAVVSAVILQN